MKNLSMISFKSAFLCVLIGAAALTSATAKKITLTPDRTNAVTTQHPSAERDEDLDALSLAEMLNSVPVDKKCSELIQKFQTKEARNRLLGKEYAPRNGFNVEFARNREVLVVTIPADRLFAPNDTLVRPDAAAVLSPLKRYLKEPDMYRVLLVMHTDNTGNEAYRDHLTEARSAQLFDWFENQDLDTSYLFSYGFGDEQPLFENNSMTNRAANRRLEVYLMPGKKMIEQAKRGRIVF